jgi:hypothetical protein
MIRNWLRKKRLKKLVDSVTRKRGLDERDLDKLLLWVAIHDRSGGKGKRA